MPAMPGFPMPQMPGPQGAVSDEQLARWAQFPGMNFPGMGGEGGMGLPPMPVPGGEGGMGMPGMEGGGGMGMPGMSGAPSGFGGFGGWRRRRGGSSKALEAVRIVLVTSQGQMDAGAFTLNKLTTKDGDWYEIRVAFKDMKSKGVSQGAMLNGIVVTGNSKGTVVVGPVQIIPG
jgi:hypothetical protein